MSYKEKIFGPSKEEMMLLIEQFAESWKDLIPLDEVEFHVAKYHTWISDISIKQSKKFKKDINWRIDHSNWIKDKSKHNDLFECPCCRYVTLSKEKEWEECLICGWWDVPEGFEQSANHDLTLENAQANFEKDGIADPKHNPLNLKNPERFFKRSEISL